MYELRIGDNYAFGNKPKRKRCLKQWIVGSLSICSTYLEFTENFDTVSALLQLIRFRQICIHHRHWTRNNIVESMLYLCWLMGVYFAMESMRAFKLY